jgi:hypothetical protein
MLNADPCTQLVLLMRMSAWHPLCEFYRFTGIQCGAVLLLRARPRTLHLMYVTLFSMYIFLIFGSGATLVWMAEI